MVLDPSGAAIAGADVILLSGDGKELSRITSDKDGGFQFEKLAGGTYKIQVQAPGFCDTIVELKPGPRATSPLRVVLPIAEQNEVVNVAGSDVSLMVTTGVSENQNANNLDRSAWIASRCLIGITSACFRAFWTTAPSGRMASR